MLVGAHIQRPVSTVQAMREQSFENITEQYSAPSVNSVTSAIVTKLWFETLLERWT